MRRLFLLMCWFVGIAPAIAAPAFQSQEELSSWFTFYYLKPEPNRVPDAIKYMSEAGVFDNRNAIPPMFGFLSGVFRDNPEKVSGLVNELSSLKEQDIGVVVLGLWYAALPDSQRAAYALINKHPQLKSQFEYLYKGTPIAIETIPLEQGPWVLDALWGRFMATGNSAAVEKIISALPWVDVAGDTARLMIGAAANWSLRSNAAQHNRVLEICEGAEKTQSVEIAAKLKAVIKEARKERQSQQNPAGNAGPAK